MLRKCCYYYDYYCCCCCYYYYDLFKSYFNWWRSILLARSPTWKIRLQYFGWEKKLINIKGNARMSCSGCPGRFRGPRERPAHRGCSGAGSPRGGAARPPNGAAGTRGQGPERPQGGPGNPARGEEGAAWWVPARLADPSSYTCVRHPNAAGSSRHLNGAAVGSWARDRPLRCPAGRAEWGGTGGGLSPRTRRVALVGHEQPELRDGVTSAGHSGAMRGFPLARHSLECLRKPGKLLHWLKDGALQRSLAAWPWQGSALPQKDVLTAEFLLENLLIKGSEWLGAFILPCT